MNNTQTCKLLLIAALTLLASSSLSGCYYMVVPIYTTCMAPRADSNVIKLQEANDNLNKRYDNRVIEVNKKIAEYKLDIKKQVSASQIAPALKSIKSFHSYTHGSQRKVIEHEDIDKGEDFIEDSLDDLMEKIEEQLQKRNFNSLEQSLKELDGLKANADQLKKLQAQRTNVKTSWLNAIIQDAQKAQADTPAAAIIYYAKAATLADEIKDKRASELQQSAKKLRDELIKAHAFYVATDAEGYEAGAILKGALSGKYSGQVRFDDSAAAPNASLSVSTQEPSYSPSTSSGTKSFKYQSGTKQVKNPKLDSFNKDIERARRGIKNEEGKISGFEREIADKQKCNSGQSREWCNGVIQDKQRQIGYRRKEIQDYNQDISKLEAQRAKTPPTLSQPIYDQQSYPVNYHHLTGSMKVVIELSGKGKPLSTRSNVTYQVTDISHGAHSRNDGSVSADSAAPPKASDVWPGLKSNVQGAISSIISKGLFNHQTALDKGGKGDQGAHHLALFMLIGPYSKEHSARLDALTGISDSTKLLFK